MNIVQENSPLPAVDFQMFLSRSIWVSCGHDNYYKEF